MSNREASGDDPFPVVPGYDVRRQLGRGGMGKVYLARQEALGRDVCIKVLALPEGVDVETARERFRREAELLAMVSHPHILTVLDFGTTADLGVPYLVTEYIEGGDLRGRMRSGPPLTIPRVRAIVAQVGEALACLQRKGILHRDLKPENILLPTDSLVKVADFGLAVVQSQKGVLTAAHFGLGTVGYASPEQQNALEVDERTDQYSLAALAYELLTRKRVVGSFAPASEHNPKLARPVGAVFSKALAQDPGKRYARLEEFLTEFDAALAASTETNRLRPLVGMGLTAVAFFTLASLSWAWRRGDGRAQGKEPRPAIEASANALTREDPPVPARSGAAPAAAAPSLEFHRLVELRAYQIWKEQGSPEGEAGEAVREANWLQAEGEIREGVNRRAFEFWVAQGRPTGPEGEAVSGPNRRRAEAELLKEAESVPRPGESL